MKRFAIVCFLICLHASQQVLATELVSPVPNPAFDVEVLPPNRALVEQRQFWRVNGAMTVYDQPNGAIVGSHPDGLNYVSVIDGGNGWTQINPGEWIPSYLLSRTTISRLTGFFIPADLPQPIGWMRSGITTSAVPGGVPEGTLLPRHRLVYAYEQVSISGLGWVRVGENAWVERSRVALVNPIAPHRTITDSPRWVGVDLDEQVLIAYEGSTPVFAALVATGMPERPTDQGVFRIYDRYETWTMDNEPGAPTFYTEDVPRALFFYEDLALHGVYWHDEFGTPRSHGCVNLSVSDAAWLFDWLTVGYDFEDTNIYSRPVVFVYQPSAAS